MPLPGNLTTIQVTGDAYLTGAGGALAGYFEFAPNVDLADAAGPAIIRTAPIQVNVAAGVMIAINLACTDNPDLSPSGWAWTITERLAGARPRTWSFYLPSTAGSVIDGVRTVDLAALVPLATPPTLVQYLLMTNDLADVASAAAAFGNIKQDATAAATGVIKLAADLGGTAEAPTVEALQGVVITGAAAANDVLTASGPGAAEWKPAPGTPLDTDAGHFQPDGVPAAGTEGLAADSGHTHPLQPWQFLITEYGAVGDLVCVIDAATTASSVITSPSGKFTPDMVGKAAVGKGFLATGVTSLVTTVASYQSATQITLSAPATATATGLQLLIGTDDTAHIQAAIDAAMSFEAPLGVVAQVVTPLAPGGLGYMVAGPLKNSDTAGNAVYNSQLTTGLHSDRLPGKVLEFVGPVDAGATRHWNQDYPALTGGTWFSAGVFPSQAAQATTDPHSISNGGNPSCLGGPTGKFGYGTSGANPVFNNLTVRLVNMSIMNTHSSSGWSYCPFNFYGTARAHLVRCGFGTNGVVQYYTGSNGSGGNTDFANPSTFSGGASLGGLMPAAGNNDDNVIEDCAWNGGYCYGSALITEHTVCKGINRSLYSWIGVNVAGSYGDGGSGAGSLHGISLGQWSVEACSYHLGQWGAGAAGIGPYISNGTLDTEGTVKVRAVPDTAADLQALCGELSLAGSPSSITFDNPTALRLIKLAQARGPVASPTYALGTAQINSFYRDAKVTITGGAVTAVKVSSLAGGAAAPAMTTLAGVTTPATFEVPAGCWWEIDGTVAPTTMQWVLT